MKKYEIFVATNGCDTNSGTIDSPLATVGAAQLRARRYHNTHQIIINIRGGEYQIDQSIYIGADDGGVSKAFPTVYRAYRNEKVVFSGGRKIPREKISHVTDEAILSRIIDKKARKKVLQADLSDFADYLNPHYDLGFQSRKDFAREIYMDGEVMELARWPKKSNVDGSMGAYDKMDHFQKVKGAQKAFVSKEARARMQMWHPDAYEGLIVKGLIAAGWVTNFERAWDVNAREGSFKLRFCNGGWMPEKLGKGKPFFFCNVLDELSRAGEYFIDYKTNIMYFIPKKDIDSTSIVVPTLDATMFSMPQFARNTVIRGINTKYTHGRVFDIIETSKPGFGNIVIENCEISNGGQTAINLRQAEHITIRNCHIHGFAHGAMKMEGCGDISVAKDADILVEGCEIHDAARANLCYNFISVGVNCCGVTIRNNKIYNAAHTLISSAHSTNLLIENNEFFNAVRDSDDAAVIYWGRNSFAFGIVIRNNYFHDWGNDRATWGNACLYADGGIGADIYNNVFENHQTDENPDFAVVKAHAISYTHTHNNIFITGQICHKLGTWDNLGNFGYHMDLPKLFGLYPDKKSLDSMDYMFYEGLATRGFFSTTWRARYRGTNWERVWNLFSIEQMAKYQSKVRALTDSGVDAEVANGRVILELDNDYWNHKLPNGDIYDGNVFDCIKQENPELYQNALNECEGKTEAQALARMHHLVMEGYWYGNIIPEYVVSTHDNICIGTLDKHIAENGKMKLGFYQADSELLLADKTFEGKPLFTNDGKFTLTDEAKAYIKEKLPDFVPFSLENVGLVK